MEVTGVPMLQSLLNTQEEPNAYFEYKIELKILKKAIIHEYYYWPQVLIDHVC